MPDPPDSWEAARERAWADHEKQAWLVFHEAQAGDRIIWGDRANPLEVTAVETIDGLRRLHVEGPRGGEYTLKEGYTSRGDPQFTAPDGPADTLVFVEQAGPPAISEAQMDDLVSELVDRAVETYRREDYMTFEAAAQDVAELFAEDVAFRRWDGYDPSPHIADPEAVYRTIIRHAPHHDPEYDFSGDERDHAVRALTRSIVEAGQPRAEQLLIRDEESYQEVVETLANRALDRYSDRAYLDPRSAVREEVDAFISQHTQPLFESILQYSPNEIDDPELYEDLIERDEAGNIIDPAAVTREMAFDTLEADVWLRVREERRTIGEHDPTIRGLTFEQYDSLVEELTRQTLQEYIAQGHRFLRTPASRVVKAWADTVENQTWAGHRHNRWQPGDADDIFRSIVLLSDQNPRDWNPFREDSARYVAVQALTDDVLGQADRLLDEQPEEVTTLPADEYLDEVMHLDMSYEEVIAESMDEPGDIIEDAIDALEGDEMGWTFVDEILLMGGRVPQMTNDWILIDYGIVREGATLRKLAWFHRESGDVLTLTGAIDQPIDELPADAEAVSYDTFQVMRHEFMSDQEQYLLQTAPLEVALNFVYDYVGADRADIRMIEDVNGDVYVQDRLEDADFDEAGVLDALVPNLSLPAPITDSDLYTLTERVSSRLVHTGIDYSGFLLQGARIVVLSWFPHWASKRLAGVRVNPNVSKKYGVGVNAAYEYGAGKDDPGFGGQIKITGSVRPRTLRNMGGKVTPDFLRNIDWGRARIESLFEKDREKRRQWYELWLPSEPYGAYSTNADDPYLPDPNERGEPVRNRLFQQAAKELNDAPDPTEDQRTTSYQAPGADRPMKIWQAKHAVGANLTSENAHILDDDAFWAVIEDVPYTPDTDMVEQLFDAYVREADPEDSLLPVVHGVLSRGLGRSTGAVNADSAEARQELYDRIVRVEMDLGQHEPIPRRDEIPDDVHEKAEVAVEQAHPEAERLEDTDESLGSLLLRGLDMKALTDTADYFDIDDFISFRVGDVVPQLDRPSAPSFEDFRQRLWGADSDIDETPPRASQYAKYRRAIAQEDAPTPEEAEGISLTAEEEAMMAREAGYDDYEQFYAEEFGNSFDNVAHRFTANRPPGSFEGNQPMVAEQDDLTATPEDAPSEEGIDYEGNDANR